MAVTADEYELPIAVENSIRALAERVGKNPNTIRSLIQQKANGKYSKMKFVKISTNGSD